MQKDSTYCYKGHEDFFIENGILRGYDEPYLSEHTNYGDFLLERLKSHPDFVGQVNGETGSEETFEEMMTKSVKCAIWLRKRAKPSDVIGVCSHNHMDMYVPFLASLYIGGTFNPWWSFGITKELTKHLLSLTKPKVLFVNEASAGIILETIRALGMRVEVIGFTKIPGLLCLDDLLDEADEKLVRDFRCTKLSSIDDPALLMFTSGTTGLPKGVLHSHRSIFGNCNFSMAIDQKGKHEISLTFSPLSWITGVLLLLRGISIKEKRIIFSGDFDEETTLRLIEKFRVSWLLTGVSGANRLAKWPNISKYDLSSLKLMFLGGAVLKEKTQTVIAETFQGTAVFQGYGCTETGGLVVRQLPNYKPGSCGTLIKNRSLKIIDPENGRILGPNETGELCIYSPIRFIGYYENPKATSEVLDCEGWYHTGDLAHYDETGNIFVTDRIKELIKYRGHHVSPALIEQVLQPDPGIKEIAVLGIPNDIDDEHPVAFVVKTPDSNITKERIEEIVAGTLPDYMKLRGGVIFLDEMPHTSTGKIGRSELKKILSSRARS